jgi:ABC-2 type transport system ATP-binding protein
VTASAAAPAIEAANLSRVFETRRERTVHALRHVDLTVPRGECIGLLGPNGAGKSTLIKILTTLLLPTSGRALVAGFDVARDPLAVRHRINLVSGGDSSGYGILTVRETLHLFARFYGVPWPVARERAEAMMEITGLAPKADTRLSTLSTGMTQKVNFARGFMSDPEIVFLDEPTLGLDVESARNIRGFLREWMTADAGRTVVLTTHYMVEADELCDRIAIIDRGRILATDTPQGLRDRVSADRRVVIELDAGTPVDAVARVPGVRLLRSTPANERGTFLVHLAVGEGGSMRGVLDVLTVEGRTVHNLSTHDPSLEDVFVAIVGRGLEEIEAEEARRREGGTP